MILLSRTTSLDKIIQLITSGNISFTASLSSLSPAISELEIVEGPGVNKTGRYVSLCPGNYDTRRLGNQLFNFAALLHVARLTGRRIAMPRRHPDGWLDRWFDVRITRVDDIQKELCPCVTVSESRGLVYDQKMVSSLINRTDIVGKNLLMCGWFQSWRYTVGVEDILRRQLRPLPNVSIAVTRYLDEVKPTSWDAKDNRRRLVRVGIHVRSGDIMTPSKFQYGYTIPTVQYFKQAIRLLLDRQRDAPAAGIQFIITGDNLPWVKSYMNLTTTAQVLIEGMNANATSSVSPPVDVVYSTGHDAGFDIILLSRCDSVVLTTGTYGWWAAWLANKTTVYFANWPRKNSPLYGIFSRDDYFPARWFSIDGPAIRNAR